ncbi:MAG: hypothetical protein LBE56_12625 [Tannerella sp.]|jgi:hypothetical protein|nr:hypothetical protein [Tannerella sp.]
MPDHDTTVIAIWEPNAVYAYTLDLAGGTFGIPGSGLQIQGSPFGTPNGNYEEGTEIVLPLFDPVKQGFVFVE